MTNDGGIRASDSDREDVVEILRDAYSTGRLTMAEFDERTTAAFAARTWGELRQLTADLPQQAKLELSHPEPDRSAATAPPRPLPAGQSRRRLSPMLPILMIWLTVALTTGHPAAFIPVLIVLVILARLTSGGPRRR
jgi:Domain of unknown function (DUF1707)